MVKNRRISPFSLLFFRHWRRLGYYVPVFANPDPVGNTTSYTYNYMGLVATETNEKNATRYYTYDALGRLVSKTDRNGRITTYTYDPAGRLLIQRDAVGNAVSYTYDLMGRVLSQTDALGNRTLYTYDALGRLLTTTDARGTVTQNTYDAVGNLVSTTQYDDTEPPEAVGSWLSTALEFNGYSDSVRLGNSSDINFAGEITISAWVKFDSSSGLQTIIGHGASNDSEVYLRLIHGNYQFGCWQNGQGDRLASAAIPEEDYGVWVHLAGSYDGENWNLYRNGELFASTQNTAGCVPVNADWHIGSSNGTDRFFKGEIRDVAIWKTGLPSWQISTLYTGTSSNSSTRSSVTTYTYDALDRLTSLTDPVGNTTSYTYDYRGLVLTETNEKNATRYYTYDTLGRLISKTDRNDRVTTYTYDSLGRLTAENWVNGNRTFLYIYDSVGNLLAAGDGASNYTYTYDNLNRNLTTTFNFDSQSAVFTYTYNSAGRQTSSSLTLNGTPSRVNTTTYDYLGNATSVRQHGNAVDEIFAEFEHNANGLLTSIRRYAKDDDTVNEIAESLYEYNSNNAVTSITHNNASGSQIVKHSYTYDETNNIVEYLNSIDGSTSYDYDFLGQLISADSENQTDESYTYDANGNRILANGESYTTGQNNELTSDGDYTYTYNAEGNRTSKTNSTNRELYTWDHRNRLTSVTQQEWDSTEQEWVTVQTVEYAYDYNNVWIRKVIGNNKTIFIPENYQTTVQIDNGATTHHYLWTPNQQDKLLADTTASGILWALTDHLGTIRDVLDGNSSTHLIYDAFGNLTSGTNPLLFGYTGKAFDTATHLQNNINRWYEASIGRWLSTDPIEFSGNDTNLYRYVLNNSIKSIDINGLKGGEPVTIIIWNDTDIYRAPDLAFCMSFKNAASYYMNSPIIEGKKMPIPASQVKEYLCNLSTRPYCVKTVIIIDHGNMAGSQLFQNQLMEKADDLLEALGNVLCEHTRIRFLLLGCGVGIKNHPEDIPPTARELIDRFSPLPNGKTRKVIVQGYPRRVDTFIPGRSGKESGRGASINTFPNPYSK